MRARMSCVSIVSKDSPFTAPECCTLRLHGKVYGHPSFNDGDWVTTSGIEDADWEYGVIRTRNTTYHVVSLDRDFVKYCEDLKEPGPGTKVFLRYASSYTQEEKQ